MPEQEPPGEPAEPPVFVRFIHPDGRMLGAAVVALHDSMVADLVVMEGETAPFGGTRVFIGVPYVARKEGDAPTPGSWHM